MPYNNFRTLTPLLCMLMLASCISQTPVSYAKSVDNLVIRFRYKVHIINGLPDNAKPLELSCHSNDDDLGHHTLWKDQEFRFKFGIHFWKKTHFVCNFSWGSKSLNDITVFVNEVETRTCRETGNCFWKVETDGIYFSNNDQNWEKRFNW
ncbi:hypothetical protein ERO13_D05G318200v2 [Gossypium hirsutum]|uniref:S-protein homolog n=3 Tax=Gossypium TaxID=3633 RepID=A0A1U8J0X9_GOSHI|nr:S-protein homolog 24-like [Gossypium hirsutum]KAB2031958.1 hypothetical protein ES319_D05G339900v1 [Gossypium barbadense]KAG4149019.1 hypothetical protein ERO13_D05G318200v2 [Gossypium hirsutum]PPD93508.1 hypothetical protein GOBAR_DD09554 [Gossypium barbadense]TYG71004.1 hypothetical protein ES288_D05G360200v1 [Gossypium darwinii]